jgi:hypothetical protein
MNWEKQPLTRALARSLRAGSRGIELAGQRFRYNDLKELWAVDDIHAVLTHEGDKSWQYWFHGAHGWTLVGVYPTRKEAQAAAGQPQDDDALEPGTYVMARWDENGRWMRVRSSSDRITENLCDIFKNLGCETRVDSVV